MEENLNENDTTDNEESATISRRETLGYLSSEEDNQPNRRGVLRGAIASSVAALGFTNVAAAIESPETRKLRRIEGELNRFERKVNAHYDEARAREAIQSRGRKTLELLSDKGYIPAPTVNELTDVTVEVDAVYEEDVDTFTSYLRIQTEIEEGQLGINVFPEAELQYAVITDSASDSATVFDPVSGTVEPDAVQISACLGANCACDEYWVTCSISGCWKDGKTGTSCCDCGNLNCRYVC